MDYGMIALGQPPGASFDRLEGVVQGASELVAFADAEPQLAGRAGVEVLALEAKMVLQGGSLSKLRQRGLGSRDWATLERLEGIVALASSRMGECVSSMDAEARGEAVNSLSQIIGLAGGAIGIIKSVF
jgi:hypothetical protein